MGRLFILLLFISFDSLAQKPIIDSSVFDKWPETGDIARISNDGNYVLYNINTTLVIQATQYNRKKEIPDICAYSAYFTSDNRNVVFINTHDSLGILSLGTSTVLYIPGVSSFKLSGDYLTYQLQTSELVLQYLSTKKEKRIQAVLEYFFTEDGRSLIIKKDQQLQKIGLPSYDSSIISQAPGISNISCNYDASKLAFITADKQLSYYDAKTGKTTILSLSYDKKLSLDNIIGFSKDEKRLFVSLKEDTDSLSVAAAVKVNVWSYLDKKLQSQRLKEKAPVTYTAAISLEKQVVFLQKENELLQNQPDHFALVLNMPSAEEEYNWNPGTMYLVSTKDGNRKRLNGLFCCISPQEKYVIYYDPKQHHYFSYNTTNDNIRNITRSIPATWTNYGYDFPETAYAVNALAGWSENDDAVFLYDQYDIWKVDLNAVNPPVNITNGYGRKHNITFRFLSDTTLSAFNHQTKENGFYSIRSILQSPSQQNPVLLSMSPYMYYMKGDINGFLPLKAKDADIYLVKRMSTEESPNFFYTKDFKTFTQLSNIHPEKDYNWMTAELIKWKTFDGNETQGILYKPDNFNPSKKYPILFFYYDKMSDKLHVYQSPEASTGDINIPWFVSRGYLVFTPDIHYKIGKTGESVVNTVVSAARFLSSKPWVDKSKMGICGHSFGAFETNYLVTHTHMFAAACSASGVSDLVNAYGSLWGANGSSQQEYIETGRIRMGGTLWQQQPSYLKNSPILYADKVTTPLLMMNNKEDSAVPFSQGVAFFTALRRLHKKVWMLQYDGEGHTLSGNAAKDYTIRITQFFDHYLKDAPAPEWMTK